MQSVKVDVYCNVNKRLLSSVIFWKKSNCNTRIGSIFNLPFLKLRLVLFVWSRPQLLCCLLRCTIPYSTPHSKELLTCKSDGTWPFSVPSCVNKSFYRLYSPVHLLTFSERYHLKETKSILHTHRLFLTYLKANQNTPLKHSKAKSELPTIFATSGKEDSPCSDHEKFHFHPQRLDTIKREIEQRHDENEFFDRSILPGAIIGDGDRKRAPFQVLGLSHDMGQ